MGERVDQRPADPAGTWTSDPCTTSAEPASRVPPPVLRGRRNRGPWLTATALVVVLLVGGALFLTLRDDPFVLDGRYVLAPEAVLADADDALVEHVEERNGVRSDDSRCWFEATGTEGDDVGDTLLCGPALFVDGDADRSWLRFPLAASPQGGDVRLAVAALPTDPQPERLADPDLLRRPDGGSPPEDSAGLQVPPPARAQPGYTAVGPFAGVEYTAPEGPSRLSGPAAAFTVTGLAAPERIGSGDDARRPAEGQRFVAVTYTIAGGEGLSAIPPTAAYQVAGAQPVPVEPALIAPGTTVEAVVSVPEDAASADLVVVDGGLVQRLSLLTGAPAEGNVQVLARINRRADVDVTQQLVATLSAPDRVPARFPVTVALDSASLQWFAGPGGGRTPSDPGRALLVLDVGMALPGSRYSAVPLAYLSLTLPDGTILRPVDLDDDPAFVLAAFEVPAGLTTAVVGFRGAATFPDGAVADFGTGRLAFDVAVLPG